MFSLVVMRHGPTAWTSEKRLQGRTDTSLSDSGREIVESWRLPAEFADFECVCSPLKRAMETAALLGYTPRIEPRLIEMSWGAWEGQVFPELREELGPKKMDDYQARGLDFRPPEGESARDVQTRIKPWLDEISASTLVFCHKGILNALFALASGWDMTTKPPVKLRDGTVHHFRLVDGNPVVENLNISLAIPSNSPGAAP